MLLDVPHDAKPRGRPITDDEYWQSVLRVGPQMARILYFRHIERERILAERERDKRVIIRRILRALPIGKS